MGDHFVVNLQNEYMEPSDSGFGNGVDNDLIDNNENTTAFPSLKSGVKLPTSTNDWVIANVHFHSTHPAS